MQIFIPLYFLRILQICTSTSKSCILIIAAERHRFQSPLSLFKKTWEKTLADRPVLCMSSDNGTYMSMYAINEGFYQNQGRGRNIYAILWFRKNARHHVFPRLHLYCIRVACSLFTVVCITDLLNIKINTCVKQWKHFYSRLVQKAANQVQKVQQQGKDAHDAWNLSSVSLVKAAEVSKAGL